MFKGNKKYYFILVAIFIAVIVLQYFQPKPINWQRSYSKKDKIPFGCYAIFNLLENTYATSTEVYTQDIYNLSKLNKRAGNTLLLVNNEIDFSVLEIKSLNTFLRKGNTVLLSASNFGKIICDTFKLNIISNFGFTSQSFDSLLKKPSFEIKYTQNKNKILKKYIYPALANESFFTSIDTSLFTIAAVNKNNMPVLIEAKIGTGRLLIGSVPDVFANIFIVNNNNRFYTYTLLSKLKNNHLIWDEYYKTYNRKNKGIFSFIFNNDALYMAYCISLGGLFFFMIFEIKRKQRAIKIIVPVQNSTLEFVDVISHVYYNSKNHKHIAEETIKYFYFDISKKFNLNTNSTNESFFTSVSQLSGIDFDKIKTLFVYCQNLKNAAILNEFDLIELNDRISKFKNQSIR